jgi:hypothetical protein
LFYYNFSEELEEEKPLLEIETYLDLYYALKSRKELRESKNPKFNDLRVRISEQIEKLLD